MIFEGEKYREITRESIRNANGRYDRKYSKCSQLQSLRNIRRDRDVTLSKWYIFLSLNSQIRGIFATPSVDG